MMRVVLDTNVLLSAVLGRALLPILEAWIAGRFVLVVSNAIVREYVAVLSRPKFGLPTSVIDSIVSYVLQRAQFVTPNVAGGIIERDPSDDKFLQAAAAGDATCIVSGDRHLLERGHYQNIPIISARAFLDSLER
jgi:putative PIN family toxin of toxin-antitoxin system